MNKTATLVKEVRGASDGTAKLWRLSEPHVGTTYVVTSAIKNPVETLVFGAESDGEIHTLTELPGTLRGRYDHEGAIRSAGYEPVALPGLPGETMLVADRVDAVQDDGDVLIRTVDGSPVYLPRDLIVSAFVRSGSQLELKHLTKVVSHPSTAYTGPTLVKDET